ncbi:MAG: hypothetical protein BMS9Abin23_0621 [Thermodesulfobacteriota bacterium]|nr:MAG: hypothetical protein BMS9Abin23_0621 [Thermodesulfobacteriota bacterium]
MDQLSELPGAQSSAMFGGVGIYSDGIFFAIIFKDRLYFKTSQKTRGAYQEMGMAPFKPNEKQTLKNYYEVPPEVIEDSAKLLGLAIEALNL